MKADLQSLLKFWKTDEQTAANISAWVTKPPQQAQICPMPTDMPERLQKALAAQGIEALYSHQAQAWDLNRAGRNLILTSGTASGKTLAFNLPVLARLLEEPQTRVLYLFPTKALAQDQLATFKGLCEKAKIAPEIPVGIYDGDTPAAHRAALRKNARVIFSNPDMLHTGILPHHANWIDLLANLAIVVVDEAHTYRGVFGSHVANVIRRLKRIAHFYGSKPQFILASATVGNAREFAEMLLGEEVELIEQDGSARGERNFIIYNPPVVDPATGLRKSSLVESVRLAKDMLRHNVQSVVFAKSRRSVEILLTQLQEMHERPEGLKKQGQPSPIRGYRSGYLPQQRREIEQGLRNGTVRSVVATNALELGIDIGGMGAALMVGYPGTIASTRQQAGRAGRGREAAAAVLVASANPLDQFLAHHPDYLFGSSPEQALLNPDHLVILLEHLRCAIFELPMKKGEGFGNMDSDTLQEFLEYLAEVQDAHLSKNTYYWMKDEYPAASISLRSASPNSVILQAIAEDGRPTTIGNVDGESASWMVHPGAIYMHEGQQFFVQEYDPEKRLAQLIPVGLDYYTEAQRTSEITLIQELESKPQTGCEKAHGEIQVTTQVTGFRKLRWFTFETLAEEPLNMPATELQTTGYWFCLSEATLNSLRQSGNWSNDPNNYGTAWGRIREQARARDKYQCQICGAPETMRQHDVHHKIPFRAFQNAVEANRLENLTTLCNGCHRRVEQNVRIRSGLAGLGFLLANLAPLFLMCDPHDLGSLTDPAWKPAGLQPTVILYELIPAGIGFSKKLFDIHSELIQKAFEVVSTCGCEHGCPACVGPGGENGIGGKQETLAILKELMGHPTAPYPKTRDNQKYND